MLKLIIREDLNGILPDGVEDDVEELFWRTHITKSKDVEKALNIIEGGQWVNDDFFIDRFGYKVALEDLSTGCKAALCVLSYPDKIIDTKECGVNAIDFIISVCREGCIIISDPEITFVDYSDGKIDVQIDNYEIFDVDRLNQYFQDERFSGFIEMGENIKCLK